MKIFNVLAVLYLIAFVTLAFTLKDKLPKEFNQQFALVEDGQTKVFVSKYEVSNANYQQFLDSMKLSLTAEEYEKIQVRGEGWKQALASAKPFETHYFPHPAYQNYPVVNVTYEAAKMYCDWLASVWSKELNKTVKVHLPSEADWNNLAKIQDNSVEMYETIRKYVKKKGTAEVYNCAAGEEFPINSFQITAPVSSSLRNDIGMFHLQGNVAEMLNEPGIAMGAHFLSAGEECQLNQVTEYNNYSCLVGFRPLLIIQN